MDGKKTCGSLRRTRVVLEAYRIYIGSFLSWIDNNYGALFAHCLSNNCEMFELKEMQYEVLHYLFGRAVQQKKDE